jgi:DNA-directed RNA polymerase subunit RPC12/RpoP
MEPFSRDERRRLLEEMAGGRPVRCPRCGGALERTDVPPRGDVAYVRDRVWLLCAECSRTVVLDQERRP